MSLALLISGQGTQHPQMLPWLAADAPWLPEMQRLLGVEDWRGALADPAWRRCNRHAQVLLTGTALAAWETLSPALPGPVAVAGYSVGEVAAFSMAGVMPPAQALAWAGERAQAMDRAAGGQPGGLLSVSGWPGPALQAWCRAFGLSVAIRLGEDAVIVGGPRPSLAAAADEAVRQGAKVSLLDIDVASHTPAMRPASEALARSLAGAALRRPRWPLISNVTGDQLPDGADAAVACLSRQVSETVRWSDCLDAVQARRPTCVLEIGPGSALATLWNRRFPDCPARSADEFRSAAAIVDWVERQAR